MKSTTTAFRTREQLSAFVETMFPHFFRPRRKFLWDMLYGVMASGDVLLSGVVRALCEDITPKKTEDRLSRNLDAGGLAGEVARAVAEAGAAFVSERTVVIVDPTEIRKDHAREMELLTTVRDASRSRDGDQPVLVRGYPGCMVVACGNGRRAPVPLALRFWSSRAPGYKGENDEVLRTLAPVERALGRRGVYVYDRGGDRPAFYDHFLDAGLDFVIRIKERHLLHWRGPHDTDWLAEQCPAPFADVLDYDSQGRRTRMEVRYGALPVTLPWRRDDRLRLVVVRRPRAKPMLLLTTLAGGTSRESLWEAVQAYNTRWRIEETIRFVKQSYGLERVRVLTFRRLENLVSIVLAAAYFTAAWLGRTARRSVLAGHLLELARRFEEVPEFALYALSEGIRHVLTRFGARRPAPADTGPPDAETRSVMFLPGFEKLFCQGPW